MVVAAVAEEAVPEAVVEEAVPEAVVEARMEAALTDAKYSSYGPPPILGRGFFCPMLCDTACHNSSAARVFTRNEKGRAFPDWT